MKRWTVMFWMTVIGAVVLLVSGCGKTTQTNVPVPITLEGNTQGNSAKIVISPGIVGQNEFRVTITDKQKVTQAKLLFSMGSMSHGKSEKELKLGPDGTWVGEGPNIMMDGIWQLVAEWQDETGAKKRVPMELTMK